MAIVRGLKAFKQQEEEQAAGKVRYLKIKDGQTVTLWLLDDLDDGTPATDLGAGVAAIYKEHKAGANFRKRAHCTRDDEGECVACERAIAQPRTGWGATQRFYANVLVDDGENEPYVAVLSQGVKKSIVFDTLVEEYYDSGSAALKPWRVRRTGADVENTKYSIKQIAGGPADFNAHERFDLNDLLTRVPYAEQEAFYGAVDEPKAAEAAVETEQW